MLSQAFARIHRLLAACGLAATLTAAAACGDRAAPAPPAEAVPAAAPGPKHIYESPAGKFALELPGVWKGRYRATERADTVAGAKFAVEFIFHPDSGSKAPPRTLLVVRVFSRDAWLRLERAPGAKIAAKLGERGNEVFGLSVPSRNPYLPGTREAGVFDTLLISIAQGGQQVHLINR